MSDVPEDIKKAAKALWNSPLQFSMIEAALLAEREKATAGVKFKLGDRVTKTKGSSWTGLIVGFYSTKLTPIGYAVESENEPGSVQIYPENALTLRSPTHD